MLYWLIKSLHIVSVIAWVGSLVAVVFIDSRSALTAAQLRAATRVTEAAIGAAWLFGITLTLMGGWYSAPWWHIKVALVVLVSALHAILHRRWARRAAESGTPHAALPFVILVAALCVVLLAVTKYALY